MTEKSGVFTDGFGRLPGTRLELGKNIAWGETAETYSLGKLLL